MLSCIAYNATYSVSGDTANIIAMAYNCRIGIIIIVKIVAYNTTGLISRCNETGISTAFHKTGTVSTRDTAGITQRPGNYGSAAEAVGDCALINATNNTAHIAIGIKIRILYCQILHCAAVKIAYKAYISFFRVFKIQTADGFTCAIECALVCVRRYPCSEIRAKTVKLTVRSQYIFIDHDVLGQNSICRAIVGPVVFDLICKPVQLTCVTDFVVTVFVQFSRLVGIALSAEAVGVAIVRTSITAFVTNTVGVLFVGTYLAAVGTDAVFV